MPKEHLKRIARRRGQPILHDEVKESYNIKLTPTAKSLIKAAAKVKKISPSEFIERWVRRKLIEPKPAPQKESLSDAASTGLI